MVLAQERAVLVQEMAVVVVLVVRVLVRVRAEKRAVNVANAK
jgi:hypothetical protein